MSVLSACSCRLYWEPGHGGSATRNGKTVPLESPPDLGRGPVYALDYVPAALFCITRSIHEAPGLMERDEIARADALLVAVSCGGAQ